MRGVGRRGVLVGIVGSLLAACGFGGRSDVGAVQDALRTCQGGVLICGSLYLAAQVRPMFLP